MAKRSKRKNRRSGEIPAKVAGAAGRTPPWFQCDWLFGLILVLAVVLAYSPVWQAGFIWDDDQHLTRPDLRSWEGLGRIWFKLGATQQYYPLVHSIFWVEHGLWGDAPLGYHLLNVFLHAFSALLLLRILRQLEVPGAWLAAALFALHPVQVETVAWATELKNVLSGVFYFAAALAYLKFDRTRKPGAYAASSIFFVLGLLSKTVISTLPAALLVVFWWKRGKLSWKRDVLPLVPFFIAGISSGLFTAWVEQRFIIGVEGADYHYTMIERILIAGRAIWFYLGKLAWPADLIFIYPRWDIDATVGWQYLFPAAVLILAVALGCLCRRWRGPLAGFLFFAGSLFPALGFFNVYPFRYSFVADHFQYLACLGIIIPCAAGLALLADWMIPQKPWLRPGFCAGLLLVLVALSWQRAEAFKDPDTLWADTLDRNPACWMAHNNLGMTDLNDGDVDKAMGHFQKAIEVRPNDAEAHYNLGVALVQKGRVDDAIAEYQKAIGINRNYAEAHNNLGIVLAQKGRVDEAIAEYQKSLAIKPDNAPAGYNLGNAFAQKERMDDAIAAYQKAIEINPNFADAYNNLGTAFMQTARMEQGIEEYQKALKINPDFPLAHDNLGRAFFKMGRLDEAIAEFQEALRLKPDYTEAQNDLANAQALTRRASGSQ
ncbi:MAG TPA: tetratricopeptide repeat protein [Candidatus Methylacidiphilales bacterium]|jgi:tetratricopeptide (TPR) repeat protein|nr:tetratricopeptide repeat protein [Candidatus Methylacidiphilales bacterium]